MTGLLLVPLSIVVLLRQAGATNRFAPDPGLQFIEEALTQPLWHVLTVGDGYVQLFPRLVAYVLLLVPFEYLAIASGLTCAVLWALGGIAVGDVLADATSSRVIGMSSVAWVVLNPGAAESMLANLFSIRWLFLTVATVMLMSPRWMSEHQVLAPLLIAIVGLSHAYMAVVFVITLILCGQSLLKDRRIWITLITASICALVQVLAFALSPASLQKYGSDTVYAPWPGMGVFWLSVLLFPPVFGGVAAAISWPRRAEPRMELAWRIAISGLLLWSLAYLQLGIKDSPSVATLGLTPIALGMAINGRVDWRPRLRIALGVLAAIPLIVLAVKYFQASWFITSGETWRSEIVRVRSLCQDSPDQRVIVRQFIATFEIPCRWIK
jgi:hypothetical protein